MKTKVVTGFKIGSLWNKKNLRITEDHKCKKALNTHKHTWVCVTKIREIKIQSYENLVIPWGVLCNH